ncbi:hypothetical protein PanWU01x14_198870, partial [Parasponia andersonii]
MKIDDCEFGGLLSTKSQLRAPAGACIRHWCRPVVCFYKTNVDAALDYENGM